MRSRVFLIAGLILLAAAAFTPSASIETAFGVAQGSLAWGPNLFRVLTAIHGAMLLLAARLPAEVKTIAIPAASLSTPWIRSHLLALIAMSAVALALRFWKLESCLWLDEVLSVTDFFRLPFTAILATFPSQNQHMFYSLLAHASVVLFGESAWSVRLPSVLLSIGSLWALYLLGRRMVGGRAALLACGLMTVSYHHIWFAQNARGYMGLLLFATLATYLWLEAMDNNRWGWWICYAVACFLGSWIHMTMVFVAVAHAAIWLLGGGWRNPLRPVTAWLLSATLTVQGHALALPEFLRTALHEVSVESEWTNPMWVIFESLRSLRIGYSGAAVLVCGAAFLLLGWASILRRSPRAAFALVLPPVAGGALMLILGHNLWPRFFFFAMGFALLIVVEGAMTLPRLVKPAWAPAIGSAFMALLIAASALTVPRVYALPKQDYTGARDFAESAAGGRIAAVGLAAKVYKSYFAPHWSFPETAGELESLRGRHPDLAVVYSLPVELKAYHPNLWTVVQRDFEPVRVFPGTLGGGEVYVCRPRGRIQARGGNTPATRGVNLQ